MLLSLQVSVLPAGEAGLLMCVVVVAGICSSFQVKQDS